MSVAPAPVFEAPWHAQVFAVTVHLNEAGYFSWSDWTTRFGATLALHGSDRAVNGGDDYFMAWLETLETYLADLGVAAETDVQHLYAAWREAYLQTPHGMPVRLKDG